MDQFSLLDAGAVPEDAHDLHLQASVEWRRSMPVLAQDGDMPGRQLRVAMVELGHVRSRYFNADTSEDHHHGASVRRHGLPGLLRVADVHSGSN